MTFKNFALVLSLASTAAFATDYSCQGKFAKQLDFHLAVGKKVVTMTTAGKSCTGLLDPSYRPTARYEGYERFKETPGGTKACEAFLTTMLGHGNTFDSLKVSPELQDGKAQGDLTFIYDNGDFHGQLVNEKVGCEIE